MVNLALSQTSTQDAGPLLECVFLSGKDTHRGRPAAQSFQDLSRLLLLPWAQAVPRHCSLVSGGALAGGVCTGRNADYTSVEHVTSDT